jgi:hypothetical protein
LGDKTSLLKLRPKQLDDERQDDMTLRMSVVRETMTRHLTIMRKHSKRKSMKGRKPGGKVIISLLKMNLARLYGPSRPLNNTIRTLQGRNLAMEPWRRFHSWRVKQRKKSEASPVD